MPLSELEKCMHLNSALMWCFYVFILTKSLLSFHLLYFDFKLIKFKITSIRENENKFEKQNKGEI